MVLAASTSAKDRTRYVAVTSFSEYSLGKIADQLVTLRRRTNTDWPREGNYLASQHTGETETSAPLRSTFEMAVWYFQNTQL